MFGIHLKKVNILYLLPIMLQEDEQGTNPLVKVWNFDKVYFLKVWAMLLKTNDCYTHSSAPRCTNSCAANDGRGWLPVNDTTVRQFTIKTPTTLEFEYNVFIYKIYSQTTHFT